MQLLRVRPFYENHEFNKQKTAEFCAQNKYHLFMFITNTQIKYTQIKVSRTILFNGIQ